MEEVGGFENEQGPLGHKAGWPFWQGQQHEQRMEGGGRGTQGGITGTMRSWVHTGKQRKGETSA